MEKKYEKTDFKKLNN